MKKVISKIKNYKPSKHILMLYIFIPIILCAFRSLTIEGDIWFLLNHGEYVLEHGFPTIEPFTFHQNFSFVMQQWLSSVIFYIAYSLLGKYGLFFIIEIIVCFILYFLYKLCMKISDNRFNLSLLITVLTTILLTLHLVARPQIFTYLNLIILIYIMEIFYDNPKSKKIYLLPLISLFQINLHASMWFILFVFLLPYLVSLIYDKYKNKKDNKIWKLLIVIIIMVIVGFINPYGIDAITYVFKSYGNYYINHLVFEMHPVYLDATVPSVFRFSLFILTIIASNITVYMVYKKGTLKLRYFLFIYGVIFLALTNFRNYGLLIIGTIPFLASYLKDLFPKKKYIKKNNNNKIIYYISNIVLIIITILIFSYSNPKFTSPLEKGIDAILENNNPNDVILYTSCDTGSYAEYRGLKPYLDARVEVFLKSNNKTEDILKEFYQVDNGYIEYENFIDKYNFTHMIIAEYEGIYKDACNDENYKVIYEGENYKVFERIENKM